MIDSPESDTPEPDTPESRSHSRASRPELPRSSRRFHSAAWWFVLATLALTAGLVAVFGRAAWSRWIHLPRARVELATWERRPHLGDIGPHTRALLERWEEGDDTFVELMIDPTPIVWIRAVELLEEATIKQASEEAVLAFRARVYRADRRAAVRLTLLPTYDMHVHVLWRWLEPWRESWRSTHPEPYSAEVIAFLTEVALHWDHPSGRVLHDPRDLRRRALDALLSRGDPRDPASPHAQILRAWNAQESEDPYLVAHARARTLDRLGDPRFTVDHYGDRFDASDLIGHHEESSRLLFDFDSEPIGSERGDLAERDFSDTTLVLLALSNHPTFQERAKVWRRGRPERHARWSSIVSDLPELPPSLVALPFAHGNDFGFRLVHASETPSVLLRWEVFGEPPPDSGFRLRVPGLSPRDAGRRLDAIELHLERDANQQLTSIGVALEHDGSSLWGSVPMRPCPLPFETLAPRARWSGRHGTPDASTDALTLFKLPTGPVTLESIPLEKLERR